MYFSAKHIKFLFYIKSITRTVHISKPFMCLKYHKNFNCHLLSPTEGKYKFTAD